MSSDQTITITVADLTPQAASALSDWVFSLAHEIDFHYGDLIRSYQQVCNREADEVDLEIDRLQSVGGEQQKELPF